MSSTVVRAEKMAAGGDAIARLADGRVAFVRGALPGELVEIEVVQAKKDFVRGEVLDVVEPSSFRVVPPCPAHAAGCGGCPWQHIAPDAQLGLKAAVVIEALKRTGKISDPDVDIGSAVPAWSYRTTLRLAAGGGGRLGLRSRSSHDVIELDGCPVSHPLLEQLLETIHVSGEGEVSLRVGAATGERSAWIVDGDVELLGLPPDVAIGPDAAVHEVVAGQRLRISAASFFQSGPAAAELLVGAVRRACSDLGQIDSLVDAYGGVGLVRFGMSRREGDGHRGVRPQRVPTRRSTWPIARPRSCAPPWSGGRLATPISSLPTRHAAVSARRQWRC